MSGMLFKAFQIVVFLSLISSNLSIFSSSHYRSLSKLLEYSRIQRKRHRYISKPSFDLFLEHGSLCGLRS